MRTQAWDLDALGNWNSITTDQNPQNRTHNAQNQITSGNMTYDGNGKLTGKDPSAQPGGQSMVYDAWNRLVQHNLLGQSASFDTHTLFAYDALGRRIVEGPTYVGISVPSNASFKDLYYSDQWQVIHEITWVETGGGGGGFGASGGQGEGSFQDGGGMFAQQTDYVWSIAYVDALVLRDHDANLDGSLEQRLYAQQDANFHVTALINTSGVAQERFIYDPYGKFTVLDAGWTTDSNGQSDWGWVYLHQGLRWEGKSETYDNRARPYDAELGRFWQQDPDRYADGDASCRIFNRRNDNWSKHYSAHDDGSNHHRTDYHATCWAGEMSPK